MVKQTVNVTNNSIGPLGLMWVVIVALQLMHVIHWSWWVVVFFPIIAGAGVVALALAIGALCAGAVALACR